MTLRELIRNRPDAFYANQTWYIDEPFMDEDHEIPADLEVPRVLGHRGVPPELIVWYMEDIQPAVVLAALYVRNPDDPIWRNYLWTSDLDRQGQRVYVGSNGHGLEIHRHLHLTDRWCVPKWLEEE